ncbi:hypothetical protein ACJMK2_033288 [Sinanodonta woodiana]|uniref:Uncharacterized protein n=1 Tax=Sinanodonta woodiana TaxID=1069815 RepID=A0ABD3WMW7_SINWO
MDDSPINMDVRKESEVNQTNFTKDDSSQNYNDTTNASEETKEEPVFPNYCDKGNVKGKVVLVVNKEFQRYQLRREGAKRDLDMLKHVFVDKLGFQQINTHDFNLKKPDLEDILKVTAEKDYSDTDVFVFAISTHGEERPRHTQQNEHALMCSDDQYVFTSDIITKFSNNRSLAGKPKLFFFQACRVPYGKDANKDSDLYDPGHKVRIITKPAHEKTVTKDNESDLDDPGHKVRIITTPENKETVTKDNDADLDDPGHKVRIITKPANEETVTKDNDSDHYDPGHKVRIIAEPANEETVTKDNDSDLYDSGHKVRIITKPANEETVTKDNEKARATQDQVDAGHSSENVQTSQGQSLIGHIITNEGRCQLGSGNPKPNSISLSCYNPCPKDCLVVYAVQSGLLAWHSGAVGSWMFHYLHEVIQNYKKSSFVDVFDVLRRHLEWRKERPIRAHQFHMAQNLSLLSSTG